MFNSTFILLLLGCKRQCFLNQNIGNIRTKFYSLYAIGAPRNSGRTITSIRLLKNLLNHCLSSNYKKGVYEKYFNNSYWPANVTEN